MTSAAMTEPTCNNRRPARILDSVCMQTFLREALPGAVLDESDLQNHAHRRSSIKT
jgi:hypothetical protein